MSDSPTCIITGAGRGIGAATARLLDGCGFGVLLVSRTAAEIESIAAELKSGRPSVADVGRPGEAERVVARCLSEFGRLDAVVNAAGAAKVVPVEKTSDEVWQEAIDTNLTSSFRFMRAAWPVFKVQKAGVVVNVSSLASRDPFPGFGAYAAAKAGVNLLSHVAAREGAAHGIRVHVVAPGAVETKMLRDSFSTDVLPPSKTLAPEDVARVIVQCVTGELAHTSGEVIYVHKQL